MAGLDTRGAAQGLQMGFNMADRVIARQDKREARKERREFREERAAKEDSFRETQLGLRKDQQSFRQDMAERQEERAQSQEERARSQAERQAEAHSQQIEANRYEMDQNLLRDGLKTVEQERDPSAATSRQKQAAARLGVDLDTLGSGKYPAARKKITSALTKQIVSDVEAGAQPDMPGDASSPERLNKRLNQPEMLEATNTYLEPFVKKNIGREGRDGTAIIDSKIVGAYSDDDGDIGFEMEVETSGGDTYKAPVTTGRSGAEGDDEVKPVSAEKLMDHVRGVTKITEGLEAQSVQEEARGVMKSRFPDSFEDSTYRSVSGEDGKVTLYNENDPTDRVELDMGGAGDGSGSGSGGGEPLSTSDLRLRDKEVRSNLEGDFMDALGIQDKTMGVPQAYKNAVSEGSSTAAKLDRMLREKGVRVQPSELSNMAYQAYGDIPTKEEIRNSHDVELTDDEVGQLYQKELEGARQQVMKKGASLIKRAEEEQKKSRSRRGRRQGEANQKDQGREKDPRQASLDNARKAINDGKNPKAVIDKLRDNGFEPDEIESAGIQLPRGGDSEPSGETNRSQPKPREEQQASPEPRQASPEPQQSGGAQRRQSRQNKAEGFSESELADLSESELVRIAQGRHGVSPTEQQGTGRTAESRRLSRDELISRILRAQETSDGESAQPRQQAPRGRGLRNQ